MAAAEARAGWQRAANRCFVQEDAKRAPKLACCPSSSSSSSAAQQYDSNNENANTGQDKCISNFVPLNWNHMSSNLPPDSKWWLQIQPNLSSQKGTIIDQELMQSENMNSDPLDSSWVTSTISMSQELLNPKALDNFSSKATETPFMDLDVPWEGDNGPGPWWRLSHKEELASLVARKSLQNIENCDLPRPAHISRNPFACLEGWEGKGVFASSKDMEGRYWLLDRGNGTPLENENLQSRRPPAGERNPTGGRSRSELLEALCHSQSRARKAEMEAQKAYEEKAYIVRLLFKQASQLFHYKQWLQVLQLESLCLQLRLPPRGKPPARHRRDARRKGKMHKKCGLCKYAFLLALGLGLAGAGLLLGCCFV